MNEFRKRIEELEFDDPMNYGEYYNGYSLMQMDDLDGLVPEIYVCSGNRTAGKTFFFKRLIVRYCIKYNKKFLLVARKRTQVKSSLESFIGDIENCADFYHLKFTTDTTDMTGIRGLYFGDSRQILGYCTYYNFADDLKEASNMFGDIDIIMKDEFQSTSGVYVEDEVQKLRSIHKSISRGYKTRIRFVACILVGNEISVINPYYLSLGITDRIDARTKKMRGHGWVFERTFNEAAANASSESAFERAFGQDKFALSSNYNIYLDNTKMIRKMNTANFRYAFTFLCNSKSYGLWFSNTCYYVSKKVDPNFKTVYAADVDSHDENSILVRRGDMIIKSLLELFERGIFRFESLECKSACLQLLGKYY